MNAGLQRVRWQFQHSRWRRWTAWLMLLLGAAQVAVLVVLLAIGRAEGPTEVRTLHLLAAIVVMVAGAFSVWLIHSDGPDPAQPPPPMPTVSPDQLRALRARVIAMSCVIVTAGIVTLAVGIATSTPPAIVVGVALVVAGVVVPLRLHHLFTHHRTP